MASSFTFGSFMLRWLFAFVLVFATYNPSGYSYISWALSSETPFGPIVAIVGVVLLIAWVVYLRATFMALDWLGVILGVALCGCIVWLLIDWGWLSMESRDALEYVVLIILSFILAVGMSWSHIRRRLSGQIDVDDVED